MTVSPEHSHWLFRQLPLGHAGFMSIAVELRIFIIRDDTFLVLTVHVSAGSTLCSYSFCCSLCLRKTCAALMGGYWYFQHLRLAVSYRSSLLWALQIILRCPGKH